MKKIFRALLVFAAALCMIISLASCGEESCQHEWDEGEVITVASCSRSGVTIFTCTKCGETDRKVYPATSHTYSDKYSFDGSYHWYEAICEHKGEVIGKEPHNMHEGTCVVCGLTAASQGLEYRGNLGEGTYRVTGIGTTLDSNVIVAKDYKGTEIVKVGKGAFSECEGLVSVTLQKYIVFIDDRAFAGSTELEWVYFTSEVTYLGKEAFLGCTSLKYIYFVGTAEEWAALEKGADWDKGAGSYRVVFVSPD